MKRIHVFVNDLRYALRGWLNQPLLALIAAASLALGIGANTAIYSIFEQIVLRPLPTPLAAQLVNLSAPGPKPGSTSNNNAGPRDDILSYPMYRDLRSGQHGLVGLAAHRSLTVSLALDGRTEVSAGMLVSGNYFDVLGLRPALGRLLRDEEDAEVGGGRVVVLGHAFWRNALGADPAVIGRLLKVNGVALEIVGVAPDGFTGTTRGTPAEVFVPISLRWALQPQLADDSANRASYWLYAFGRLDGSASREQVAESLNRHYRGLLEQHELPLLEGVDAPTRAAFAAKQLQLSDGSRGQSQLGQRTAAGLATLWLVSALVLLIACMNVANLLLARGAARAGELALRASIGASQRRLLAQLLTEALALGLLGAVLSLPAAATTLQLIGSLLPDTAQRGLSLQLDLAATRFALLSSLTAVLLFGLLPALQLARSEPIQALRSSPQGGSRLAARFRSTLATSQVALSMAALVLAGLFSQSLHNLHHADTGLQIESVLQFSVAPQRNGYSGQQSEALYDALLERLAALPGVSAATSSVVPLLSGDNWGTEVIVPGHAELPGSDRHTFYNEIGEDFFATFGIALLAGSEFSRADAQDRPQVAIVNRRFLDKFGLDPARALGSDIRLSGESVDTRIIGLIDDTGYDNVRDNRKPQLFLPRRQRGEHPDMVFYLRSALPVAQLLPQLRAEVAALDAELPVENLRTLIEQVQLSTSLERLISALALAFAALATLLAAIGLYGVINYSLTQRTREFGLRLALGAQPSALRGLLLAQLGSMLALGGAIGLLLALLAGRAAAGLLFGVTAHDPGILLGAALLLATVALLAGLLPAYRVSRIDPQQALRHD